MSEIETVLQESRSFPPPPSFQERALLSSEQEYQRLYRESIDDPEGFWGRVARELPWIEPFERVLDWSDAPVARWFEGGKINASAVCVDRHAEGARADKTAILWEGEPGDVRSLTYAEL
jgi:acetyl-CoA synthetase